MCIGITNFAANGALLHIYIQRHVYVWVRKVSNKAKAMGPHRTQTKQTYKKQKQILIKGILNCCNIRVTQHIKEIVSTTIWNGTTSTNWTVVYKSCGNKLEIYPYIITMGIACNVLHSIHSVNPY